MGLLEDLQAEAMLKRQRQQQNQVPEVQAQPSFWQGILDKLSPDPEAKAVDPSQGIPSNSPLPTDERKRREVQESYRRQK